ncbi:MAG: glycosyltransferase [bacterium]
MEVSLILPIYRAESFIGANLQAIDEFLSKSSRAWELVLVVDGSPDRSIDICREFARQKRSYAVEVLLNETNLGKGATVKRGMLAAKGDYRIFTDCDLAYPMTEMEKVLKPLLNGKEVSIASRTLEGSHYIFGIHHIRHIYFRHLVSRGFHRLVHLALPMRCGDTQAGLKGFSAHAAEFLFSQLKLTGFSFDVELLHLAEKASLPVEEVAVYFHHHPGSTMNFFTDGLKMFRDVMKIRRWTSQGLYDFSPRKRMEGEIVAPAVEATP